MTPLRAFASGLIIGALMFPATMLAVSFAADVRWQLVPGKVWRQQEADRHYGCSERQADPATGECR